MSIESGFVCPRCGRDLPQDNLQAGLRVCACGWIDESGMQKLPQKTSKSVLKFMGIVVILLIPLVIYFAQWRGYGVEANWIRLNAALGTASASQLEQLAVIYQRTGDKKKAMSIYQSIINKFPKQYADYLMLAQMNEEQNNYSTAAQLYSQYLTNGGPDDHMDITYEMAQALGKSGQIDQASALFEKILNSDSKTLQVGVAQTYVQMLIDNNQLDKAESVIRKFQSRGSNGRDYLNGKLAEIKQKEKTAGK